MIENWCALWICKNHQPWSPEGLVEVPGLFIPGDWLYAKISLVASTSLSSPAGVGNMSPSGLLGSGDIMPTYCEHGDWGEESNLGSIISCRLSWGTALILSFSLLTVVIIMVSFHEKHASSLWEPYILWGPGFYLYDKLQVTYRLQHVKLAFEALFHLCLNSVSPSGGCLPSPCPTHSTLVLLYILIPTHCRMFPCVE